MGKFVNKIKEILGSQKEILKKYYLTFIIIAVTTLLMVILGFEDKTYMKIYSALILTDILIFAVETWLDNKWYRIPIYIVCGIIGTITMKIMYNANLSQKEMIFLSVFYCISLIITTYKIIKNSELEVSQYVSKWFNNSVIWGVATVVIQLGALFIVSIINSLLFKNSFWDVISKTEIFLLGMVILPGEILCALNTKNEVIKPIRTLICFIIAPIVNIAEIVIYIYLFKILATREIPSNTIYPIIASLFAFAFPTWIMLDSFKEKYKYSKINSKIMPYSFIILIALQIYSIGIRIAQVGLTPQRYMAVILIIFEIITIILSVIKEQKYIKHLFIITIGLIVIMCCIPGINMIDASWKSQVKRIESVYSKDDNFQKLNDENKKIVRSAYNYLKIDDEGKKHIPEYIKETEQEIEQFDYVYEYHEKYKEEIKNTYIHYNLEDEEIELDEFSKLQKIEYSTYQNKKIDKIYIEEFDIYKNDKEKNENVQKEIKNFFKQTIEQKEVQNKIIKLDETHFYLLDLLEIRYNPLEEEIEYVNIRGYLLTR